MESYLNDPGAAAKAARTSSRCATAIVCDQTCVWQSVDLLSAASLQCQVGLEQASRPACVHLPESTSVWAQPQVLINPHPCNAIPATPVSTARARGPALLVKQSPHPGLAAPRHRCGQDAWQRFTLTLQTPVSGFGPRTNAAGTQPHPFGLISPRCREQRTEAHTCNCQRPYVARYHATQPPPYRSHSPRHAAQHHAGSQRLGAPQGPGQREVQQAAGRCAGHAAQQLHLLRRA